MLNIQFGPGVAIFVPNYGNLAVNPTPIQLKVFQEGSVDFKGDLKKLYGQNQGAVATARGKEDVTGKMKVGALDVNDLNQIRFGQVATTGGAVPVPNESHTPAASVTPTVGSGLLVTTDLGVINNDTGRTMTKVPSTPAVGQYTFTPATTGGSPMAAAYGFNASETASKVLISYLSTVTGGTTITLANQPMGYAPEGALYISNGFRGQQVVIQLNQVTFGGVSIPTKQEDFWISDLDFSANVDVSGLYGLLYSS